MSEASLYRLSQRLRLLARAGVLLNEEGRRLSGDIHQEIEVARTHLEDMLDQVLDGHPLGDLQQRHISWCRQLVEANRPAVQQLELQFRAF
jgi:hypothetical protein